MGLEKVIYYVGSPLVDWTSCYYYIYQLGKPLLESIVLLTILVNLNHVDGVFFHCRPKVTYRRDFSGECLAFEMIATTTIINLPNYILASSGPKH